MPKTREQKRDILELLRDKIIRSKSVIFATYDKLEAKEGEELRKQLKKENSEYYVAKKTLMKLAFKDKGIENLNPRDLDGKIAAIFGYEDEVAPSKIIAKFQKDHVDKISFVAGILENKLLSAAEVTELSKLPSKQELYAKIVGSINAPISGFVNVLAGNLKNLVYVLKAIEEKGK